MSIYRNYNFIIKEGNYTKGYLKILDELLNLLESKQLVSFKTNQEAYKMNGIIKYTKLNDKDISTLENLNQPKNNKKICLNCGLIVDKIPKHQEGECPNGIQHYFVDLEKGDESK